MNKNKGLLKTILLLIGAILFPFFVVFIDAYITFEHPGIKYDGDKSVPKEDVISYGKITLRDLRLDKCTTYDGDTLFIKYYIVKKNLFSKKKLNRLLSKYCSDYYKSHNSYDEIGFFFYKECGTMPWYWNNHGYFPDLEMKSRNLICRCFVNKDEIKLIEGGW